MRDAKMATVKTATQSAVNKQSPFAFALTSLESSVRALSTAILCRLDIKTNCEPRSSSNIPRRWYIGPSPAAAGDMEKSRKDSSAPSSSMLLTRKEQRIVERSRLRSRSVFTKSTGSSDVSKAVRESKSFDTFLPWLSNRIGSRHISVDNGDNNIDDAPVTVSTLGVITLRLREHIRVDIALDRAVRILNPRSRITLALSASGSSAALLHPNGRVYQYGSRVEILAMNKQGNNKLAKMWYKGVSFTSEQCALVYLVDSAGTRTTTDTFSDLMVDFSIAVFCNESLYNEASMGTPLVNEALTLLHNSTFWVSDDGTNNWMINNVRVSQTLDGLVRIGRNATKYALHTSPTNGSARISSPFLHCTGSMGPTRHLFVRRGERRMHYDGASFIVRNAGHSAGFDDTHQLKVY